MFVGSALPHCSAPPSFLPPPHDHPHWEMDREKIDKYHMSINEDMYVGVHNTDEQFVVEVMYSRTSDNGHSEEWTTSLQWSYCCPYIYL